MVPFEHKDKAKTLGAKFDFDKKLWYVNNIHKNKYKLLEQYEEYKIFENIVGENREFRGQKLFVDLIPRTSWFNNVRSSVSESNWLRIRKYVYERVNYTCECCGLYCKHTTEYNELDKVIDDQTNKSLLKQQKSNISDDTELLRFDKIEELKTWNTIRLEAHERFSYDKDTKKQKLERIVALCHRCHSVTHYGLTGLRGLSEYADKHLMKVNNWTTDRIRRHYRKKYAIWNERNKIEWTVDLTILTNSGIYLK